ncbi:MAG: hypothetical protein AAB575_03220 [Patescibacteria group bacterium]
MLKHAEAPQVNEADEQMEIKQIISELEILLADQWLKRVKAKDEDFIKYPQERNSWFTRSLFVLQDAVKFLMEDNARIFESKIQTLIESVKKKEEQDAVYVRKISELVKLALIELKD